LDENLSRLAAMLIQLVSTELSWPPKPQDLPDFQTG
jgi:hypothetical protein